MAAVPFTVILEPKKITFVTVSIFPHLFAMKWWDWMPRSLYLECRVFSKLFHSPLSPSSRGSLVPFCFLPLKWYYLHIWGCWYFSQQSCESPRLALLMMYSTYELNKQHNNIQPLTYSFPNFEAVRCSMSDSNYCFLSAYRFLRRQVRWPGIPISLRTFQSLLWSTESKDLA